MSDYRLKLGIPEQKPAPHDSFLANPKDLSVWIAKLPMANLGETCRQLYETLTDFNRQQFSPQERLRIADELQKPAAYVTQSLEQNLLDIVFPLDSRVRKIASFAQELQSELALSYKIVVADMLDAQPGWLQKKPLCGAIQKALTHLSHMMFHRAILYAAFPEGCWRDINQLYAISENRGLDELELKAQAPGNEPAPTIGHLYKRILLFTLVSTNRLRQREIQTVYQRCLKWANRTEIGKPTEDVHKRCRFVLNLQSDQPASHAALKQGGGSGDDRMFNTRELVHALSDLFKKLPSGDPPLGSAGDARSLSKPLLRKLIYDWCTVPKREFTRIPTNTLVHLTIGLPAIHARLQSMLPAADDNPPEAAAANPELNLVGGSIIDQEPLEGYASPWDYFQDAQPGDLAISARTDPAATDTSMIAHTAPIWLEPSQGETEIIPCRAINESAGGFCINVDHREGTRIRVGDLVGLSDTPQTDRLGLGIVRWVENSGQESLKIGLQMIAPHADATTASPADRPDTEFPCLVLPSLETIGRPSSCILADLSVRPGARIRTRSGETQGEFVLTKLLETTGSFRQFQYSPAGKVETQESGSDSTAAGDFDELWNTL